VTISITLRRSARILAAALVLAAAMPAAALAKPSEFSCAAARAVPFSTSVPQDFRSPGVHGWEWYSEYDNADGTSGADLATNEILIDPAADAYPNTVLLRLFGRTTLLANGDVIGVDAMRPDQDARFYIAAYSIKGDTVFLDSFRTWFRYERAPGDWTAWVELERGPVTSFCNQVTKSAWKKAYGWD